MVTMTIIEGITVGDEKILAINPGSTSTKVALFSGETEIFRKDISHSTDELSAFSTIFEQLSMRFDNVMLALEDSAFSLQDLSAVVGRGGTIIPVISGTYLVDESMVFAINNRFTAEHSSLLGGLLALEIAKKAGRPAFIVDPVSVDEFHELARYSGHPLLPRHSLAHALNIKAVARRGAEKLGRPYDQLNLVIAHLGGGISITAHQNGRMVDVSNANDGGPFSPERTGYLPVTGLVELCYSGKYDKKTLLNMILKKGGLVAYLGTNSAKEVEGKIARGDKEAALVYQAMIYNIAKEIGAMAAILSCNPDSIILTGGLAHSEILVKGIRERVEWMAPIMVFPGEDEMPALVQGALRVLRGQEEARSVKQFLE